VSIEDAPGAAPARQPDAPSPIASLGGTIRRLPRYLVLARNLLRDPKVGRWRKAGLAASLAYVASPIDLVPGLIPVAGQLDDLAALLLGIRSALRGSSHGAAEAHLRAAGLTAEDLDRDLANVRAAAGWIADRVGRAGVRAAKISARVGKASAIGAAKLLGVGARGARKLAGAAARRVREG
jgi:uncharacterized membrane protein YkvA (DUF1232 family)